MAKISKTQFEKWSKDFKKILESFLHNNESNLTPQEYVNFVSFISQVTKGVEKQIPLAVMLFIATYESLPGYDLIKNNVYSDLDGLTLQQ
jgi:hypothetical protein